LAAVLDLAVLDLAVLDFAVLDLAVADLAAVLAAAFDPAAARTPDFAPGLAAVLGLAFKVGRALLARLTRPRAFLAGGAGVVLRDAGLAAGCPSARP